MQTSKIQVGSIYAVRVMGGALSRFDVKRIVTNKTNAGTSTTIHGDLLDVETGGRDRSYEPGSIIGPYQEIKELADKREAEVAAADAKQAKKDADRRAVQVWLYHFVHQKAPPPKSKNKFDHTNLFRESYAGVEITQEGCTVILEELAKRSATKLIAAEADDPE